MEFVEHKQELSKFCHLYDFSVSPVGNATHVKTTIKLTPRTGQHFHAN
jgi:hypothetical protein